MSSERDDVSTEAETPRGRDEHGRFVRGGGAPTRSSDDEAELLVVPGAGSDGVADGNLDETPVLQQWRQAYAAWQSAGTTVSECRCKRNLSHLERPTFRGAQRADTARRGPHLDAKPQNHVHDADAANVSQAPAWPPR